MHTVQRTLVKSPPELWAELSDPGSLARHLDAFGEVRIVDVRPEQRVAWESDRAAGVIELEPQGWGTRVSLSADAVETADVAEPEPVAAEPDPEPDARAEPEPEHAAEPEPDEVRETRAGFFSRLLRRVGLRREAPVLPHAEAESPQTEAEPGLTQPHPEPQAPEPPAPIPPRASFDPDEAAAALESVLDTLGAAHHRPFSRG